MKYAAPLNQQRETTTLVEKLETTKQFPHLKQSQQTTTHLEKSLLHWINSLPIPLCLVVNKLEDLCNGRVFYAIKEYILKYKQLSQNLYPVNSESLYPDIFQELNDYFQSHPNFFVDVLCMNKISTRIRLGDRVILVKILEAFRQLFRHSKCDIQLKKKTFTPICLEKVDERIQKTMQVLHDNNKSNNPHSEDTLVNPQHQKNPTKNIHRKPLKIIGAHSDAFRVRKISNNKKKSLMDKPIKPEWNNSTNIINNKEKVDCNSRKKKVQFHEAKNSFSTSFIDSQGLIVNSSLWDPTFCTNVKANIKEFSILNPTGSNYQSTKSRCIKQRELKKSSVEKNSTEESRKFNVTNNLPSNYLPTQNSFFNPKPPNQSIYLLTTTNHRNSEDRRKIINDFCEEKHVDLPTFPINRIPEIREWIRSLKFILDDTLNRSFKNADDFRDGVFLCQIAADLSHRLGNSRLKLRPVNGMPGVFAMEGCCMTPMSNAQMLHNINLALQTLGENRNMPKRHLWNPEAIRHGKDSIIWELLSDIKSSVEGVNLHQSKKKIRPTTKNGEKNGEKYGKDGELYQTMHREMKLIPHITLEQERSVKSWLFRLGLNLAEYSNDDDHYFLDDPYRNGVLLCELLQLLESRSNLPSYQRHPKTVSMARGNIHRALTQLRKLRDTTIPSIYFYQGEAILKGDRKIIFGLLWNLMQNYPPIEGPPDGKWHLTKIRPCYSAEQYQLLEESLRLWLQSLGLPCDLKEGIQNGTLICDLAGLLENKSLPGIFRKCKSKSIALSNIRKALCVLRRSTKVSMRYLWNEIEILEGNRIVILGLLEDLHRSFASLPPRPTIQTEEETPFFGDHIPTLDDSNEFQEPSIYPYPLPVSFSFSFQEHNYQPNEIYPQGNLDQLQRDHLTQTQTLTLANPMEFLGNEDSHPVAKPPVDKLKKTPPIELIENTTQQNSQLLSSEQQNSQVREPDLYPDFYQESTVLPYSNENCPDIGPDIGPEVGLDVGPEIICQKLTLMDDSRSQFHEIEKNNDTDIFPNNNVRIHLKGDSNVEKKNETEHQMIRRERITKESLKDLFFWLKSHGIQIVQKKCLLLQEGKTNEFSDGLVLIKLIERCEGMRDIEGINKNPKAKASCLHNINKVFDILRKRKNMPLDLLRKQQDIYNGNPKIITLLLLQIKKKIRDQFYHTTKEYHGYEEQESLSLHNTISSQPLFFMRLVNRTLHVEEISVYSSFLREMTRNY